MQNIFLVSERAGDVLHAGITRDVKVPLLSGKETLVNHLCVMDGTFGFQIV